MLNSYRVMDKKKKDFSDLTDPRSESDCTKRAQNVQSYFGSMTSVFFRLANKIKRFRVLMALFSAVEKGCVYNIKL